MNIFSIIIISVIVSVLAILIKQNNPTYSVLLIITLSFTIYAIYHMLNSSIYSLKELKVFDEIF